MLDCPDACTLHASIEDGRLVELVGSHDDPLTAGVVCSKVRHFHRHVYGPQRLSSPAVRTGDKGTGAFRAVTWNEALEHIAGRLRAASCPEAVLPLSYGGSNGLLTQGNFDDHLFHALGASRLARTVCAAPSTAAAEGLTGKMPGVPLLDYEHARLIVVWGANPTVSGIHLVPVIRRARARGAKLVVVDPRRTSLVDGDTLHLAPRVGTDVVLALALVREFFARGWANHEFLERHATGVEELQRRAQPWTLTRAAEVTGLAPAQLESFADIYATASPAVIRIGWGLERNRNGGSAVAAIIALAAVAGKFGVRGGGYTMSNSRAIPLAARPRWVAPPPETRIINMNQVGRALTEAQPPIEVLFVYNCNPLATLPDQARVRRGLARDDLFTVVFDQVETDTARFADVVLPATTFVEHAELGVSYGTGAIHRNRPVLSPHGQARSNPAVFRELCHRLGVLPAHAPDLATLEDDWLASAPDPAALVRQLDANGVARPTGSIQFVDLWPATFDRRIHLVPPALDAAASAGLYAYQPDPSSILFPLSLISPATSKTISSTLGQLHTGDAALVMHPDDANPRALEDGAWVRVFNELGEVHCRVRVNATVRPGVVSLPKGLWSQSTGNGNTANVLCPDSLSDIGGGATFNDARVQVERLERPHSPS